MTLADGRKVVTRPWWHPRLLDAALEQRTKDELSPSGGHWPDGDEDLSLAAAREAGEEAGLSGAVSRHEIGRYFYAKVLSSGEEVPCEVLVFPLEVDRIADKWKEKGQRKRKWVSPSEAARMINEPDLCDLISAFGGNPGKFAA